ncbi:hypothetical protein AVEN_227746-1 [Araneus ventricosus]|uniref:Uncharacterized protein n=1 Tax=Araneus ventricosus TaxID=182803 RepID=A0A4Y2LR74_ARAVE|nr:hypothetical protein AVEN_227746-1 [Araneus ventricosus]
MTNVNKKNMECLLIVRMHINREELSTERSLPGYMHFVIPSIKLPLLGPSFCPPPSPKKFTGHPLTTSVEAKNQKTRLPPLMMYSTPKSPRLLFFQPKSPLPYVTSLPF